MIHAVEGVHGYTPPRGPKGLWAALARATAGAAAVEVAVDLVEDPDVAADDTVAPIAQRAHIGYLARLAASPAAAAPAVADAQVIDLAAFRATR
jgi:hypothetical protein